ncbi:cytidylyltransferase domain-containing protein [Sulfurimonas sp.]|uniref:acylneuraminate cytidylyltransferase family protein n=1 Tax=Sulfurimonas sp. TaxID=2022749 RepID=UPI003D0FC981
MKKVIAMVPARIGSKRVPKKNLRLIDGKPLIAYILETLKQVDIFDKIYLNADDLVFEKIAQEYGVEFYYRKKEFATDKSTNDEFALDFMNNVEGDVLLQILPTSPLITATEIEDFTHYMLDNNLETLISVEHKQIACTYNDKPLNFDKLKKNPPSQEMTPIKAYATVLMGWDYNAFKNNMHRFGSAYHGGDSKTAYYQVKGLSTIDIDNEEDFVLAQTIISAKKSTLNHKVEYYS